MSATIQVAPVQWQTFAALLSTRFDFADWLISTGSTILQQNQLKNKPPYFPDFCASLSIKLFEFLCSENGLSLMVKGDEIPGCASTEKAASFVTSILLDTTKSPICLEKVYEDLKVSEEVCSGVNETNSHKHHPPPIVKDWWSEKKEGPPFDPRLLGCRLRSFTAEQAQSLIKSDGCFGRVLDDHQLTPEHQQAADPFYGWFYGDIAANHWTLPRPIPGTLQWDSKCLNTFKVDTLKTFCRQQKLALNGAKKKIVERIGDFLAASKSMQEFDDRLEELNDLFFNERRYIDGSSFVMKFRTRPPLDVGKLLPDDHPDYPPPLPQINPWSIREELTPPILLFRLDNQVGQEYQNGDNYLTVQIHHTFNTPLILNVYKAIDRTLPTDRLLLRNNLDTFAVCCLKAFLSVPGSTNAWSAFAVTKPSTELRLPHGYRSGPLQLTLWRIRSCDNLVIQLVRAFHSPNSFPSTPIMTIPRSLSMESVMKTFFGHKDQGQDELVVDSISVSLRCPLSLSLIQTPIRSMHCEHLQCFDYSSFVSVYSGPIIHSFKCPVCYKDCAISSLVVDEYFKSMIESGRSFNDPTATINPTTGEFKVTEGCDEEATNNLDGDEMIVKKCRLLNVDVDEELMLVNEQLHRLSNLPVGSSWMNPIVLD